MTNKKGLTLVEVVIAMAVFMIAVVMAYPIITQSGKSNIVAQRKTNLQELGNYVAENLLYKTRNYDSKEAYLNSDNLDQYGLCTSDITDCDDEVNIGVFSRVNPYQYETTYESKHISIKFNQNDNLVRIKITQEGTSYETIEWLRYAK